MRYLHFLIPIDIYRPKPKPIQQMRLVKFLCTARSYALSKPSRSDAKASAFCIAK